MLRLKPYHLYSTLVVYGMLFNVATAQQPVEMRYVQQSTIPLDWDHVFATSYVFADSLTGNVIKQYKNPEGIPLFYAQDILTSVCFDNQCRQLDITVYWNITGRYLGFKLPEKEFLSRYDHEPFTKKDYEQLNVLLSDPYLPLDNISFDALIDQANIDLDSIDGVSGATSNSISAFVIKGAAYTTYTLWNIIHGQSKARIRSLTEKEVTQKLLSLILKSPSSDDRIWGFEKIKTFGELDEVLMDALLENIWSEEFYVAHAAINSITPNHLRSESLQMQLFSVYEKGNYSLRKSIIDKLDETPTISPGVINVSRNLLKNLDGEQLGYLLEFYHRHDVADKKTNMAVAELLYSDNRFISKKVHNYLLKVDVEDSEIIRELKKYEQTEK